MLQLTLFLIVGLAVLVFGGNLFVGGAASLARLWRVRPLIVGVVIIGFGTSAPEMLISLLSVLGGQGELGVGNVVGSNIANIGLVMAAAALITPLAIDNSLLRRELPLTVAITVLFGVLVLIDGQLDPFDGALLLLAFLAVMIYLLRLPQKPTDRAAAEILVESEALPPRRTLLVALTQTLGGLLLVLVGAQVTVDNAAALARDLGLSDAVIGLTVVAVGTSLPELVSAVIAALKKETDLIVGNVLGSNIYNLAATGGMMGLLAGQGLVLNDTLRFFSSGLMLVLMLLLVPLLRRGMRLDRLEGGAILVAYLAYTFLLF